MTSTLKKIKELVEKFDRNMDEYRHPSYNETLIRVEFVNPFWNALGWDVNNEAGYAMAYRDVIHEAEVKIGAMTKAPDYSFRIGGTRKFFLETKKPAVNLKSNPAPAFQLRRYAYSAQLPVSILTDFEELIIYDCRRKPAITDKAHVGRMFYVTFEEYVEKWEELNAIFSKEAVMRGNLDRWIVDLKGKKPKAEIDKDFLADLDHWRLSLARNMALRNLKLTRRELNWAVQLTIDRLIFLRMCEDRGIESQYTLQTLQNGGRVYPRLVEIYDRADERYNSGLFHFQEKDGPNPDTLTPHLNLDDNILKEIVSELYYPKCAYEFSVLPVEILGNAYEQFLGKVIHLTKGHHAKIEEKPEVRKSGGVYYTPQYIVDYIVQNTVGKLVEGKTPKEVSALRILDPACGSGSFLLGAFQFLLDWHLKQYVSEYEKTNKIPTVMPDKGVRKRKSDPEAIFQGMGGAWYLSTAEKKRILINNIYGVDIDANAVEVTKLSLLLKVLENESSETIHSQMKMWHERALPNLSGNIKCGNSLIGSDFYERQQTALFDEEEALRINAFDWEKEFPEVCAKGGFDAVIGNPPYIRIQAMKEWAPTEVEFYKQKYKSASKGNYDIYVVFIEKGLALLNQKGLIGYILPHKFFNAKYGEPIRTVLAKGRHLSEVVHFGDQQVFESATTYTCLLRLSKQRLESFKFIRVTDIVKWRDGFTQKEGLLNSDLVSSNEWNFVTEREANLFYRLDKFPTKLSKVSSIFVGLQTSADKVFILEEIKHVSNKLLLLRDINGKEWLLEKNILKPFLYHVTISTYEVPESNYWIIFPYNIEANKVTLISDQEMILKYPKTWEYLKANSKSLRKRESGKVDNQYWYGYIYRKNMTLFENPKIIVQVISLFGRYAFDNSNLYFTGGGNGPYYGIRWNNLNNKHSIHYLQAILNSPLLDFYHHKISSPFRGGYWSYGKRFIERLPIRTVDFNNSQDVEKHDKVVYLVSQMLDLHKKLEEAKDPRTEEQLQRRIDATDNQIDRLVYELYGLTEKEIKIVEEST